MTAFMDEDGGCWKRRQKSLERRAKAVEKKRWRSSSETSQHDEYVGVVKRPSTEELPGVWAEKRGRWSSTEELAEVWAEKRGRWNSASPPLPSETSQHHEYVAGVKRPFSCYEGWRRPTTEELARAWAEKRGGWDSASPPLTTPSLPLAGRQQEGASGGSSGAWPPTRDALETLGVLLRTLPPQLQFFALGFSAASPQPDDGRPLPVSAGQLLGAGGSH
jgi:hypothetical protein